MPLETRIHRDARARRTGVAAVVLVGLGAVAGTALAVHLGARPTAVTVVVVLGVAVGAALIYLRGVWSLLAFLVSVVGGTSVVRWTEPALVPAWLLLLFLGIVLGQRRRWVRQQAARPAAALPAFLRTVHDEGDDEVEVADPSPYAVRRLVEALDGRTRTGISVFRGTARLDVGGDAGGHVVVHQCDDATTRLPLWSVVLSGPDPWAGPEVELRVAGIDAHLPAGGVTSVGPALAALDAFLASGGRAPELAWRTDGRVEDLRAVFDGFS